MHLTLYIKNKHDQMKKSDLRPIFEMYVFFLLKIKRQKAYRTALMISRFCYPLSYLSIPTSTKTVLRRYPW